MNLESPLSPTQPEKTAAIAVGSLVGLGTESDGRSDPKSHELKRSTTRGALISTASQAASFAVRIGSMMILARLLLKEDFGLVNMVTAFTGFLGIFRDAGLGMAAVQRASITDAQSSTLFWVNLGVGGLLAALAGVIAPMLVLFYGEPRLFWVTVTLGTSFLFNGAAAQHRAQLQRAMRFATLVIIDAVSLIVSTAVGIAMAVAGYGYWALVVMTICPPIVSVAGIWWATGWVPGWPLRGTGVRSMLRYGGLVTVNNVIFYLAYNVDKMLLGRFWGAEALGVYGRSYQLVNIPTENLNSTIGLVAFPGLSRLQNDPARVRSFFLRGYGLYLALVMPITVGCALYAEDIVRVFLGAKWHDAAPIFRLMAPTILVFGLTNPFGWLMLSLGQAARNLKIAFLVAPVVILSYVIGLRYGSHGVAAGFSIAMVLLVVPVIGWAKHGTLISNGDMLKVIAVPLASVVAGAAAAWGVHSWVDQVQPAFPRLVAGCSVLFGVYLLVLLFVMKQKAVYIDLLRSSGLWPFGARRNREGLC